MTGRGAPAVCAHTLIDRQSSLRCAAPLGSAPVGDGDCGHAGPNVVAARTADHDGGAAGGANRRAPIGAAAYGMPRKIARSPMTAPRTGPDWVETSPAARVLVDRELAFAGDAPRAGPCR